MKIAQFNTRWHSPINVFMHSEKLAKSVGKDSLEKDPEHQKAREAKIAAVMGLVLSSIRNLPAYTRLPLNEPPDAYLMQPNNETMDITSIELTSYRPSSESLLEQLKRKKFKQSYPSHYILLIELFTEDKVDYEEINKYAVENKIPFPIWALRKVQQSPDTIAEVVIMNPKVFRFSVNIGKEAYYYKDKYKGKAFPVIFTKRAGKVESVRSEASNKECIIAPWDDLEN